jgi:hypothetical protein
MEKAKKGISGWLLKWLTKDLGKPKFPLCDFEKICREIKPCDVLLIEGTTRISHQIRHLTNSSWSHACLYIGRIHEVDNILVREMIAKNYKGNADDQLIFESNMGDGTVVSSIERYKRDHIRICRPRGLLRSDGQKIIHYCLNSLGKSYSMRQIFDLLRLLLPIGLLPRTLGSSLFKLKKNEPNEVCSSLVARAFMSVQFPLLPIVQVVENGEIKLFHRNPKLFTPRDFDYSPYFDIIKYPMIVINYEPSYRSLPWADDTLSVFKNDDGKEIRVTEDI